MGGTRALVTFREISGATIYVNDRGLAQFVLERITPLRAAAAPAADPPVTELAQRLAVIGTGLELQDAICGDSACVPLSQAVKGLRAFTKAFNGAKHLHEPAPSGGSARGAPPPCSTPSATPTTSTTPPTAQAAARPSPAWPCSAGTSVAPPSTSPAVPAPLGDCRRHRITWRIPFA